MACLAVLEGTRNHPSEGLSWIHTKSLNVKSASFTDSCVSDSFLEALMVIKHTFKLLCFNYNWFPKCQTIPLSAECGVLIQRLTCWNHMWHMYVLFFSVLQHSFPSIPDLLYHPKHKESKVMLEYGMTTFQKEQKNVIVSSVVVVCDAAADPSRPHNKSATLKVQPLWC